LASVSNLDERLDSFDADPSSLTSTQSDERPTDQIRNWISGSALHIGSDLCALDYPKVEETPSLTALTRGRDINHSSCFSKIQISQRFGAPAYALTLR
jgi:hypothetical protein